MDVHLAGKVAVVTGASKGIGLAVTRALADEGVSVVAGARSMPEDLSRLTAASPVRPVSVDLGTPDGPARLVAEAVATFGGLDILVNNVGAVRPRPEGFLSVTDDDWISTLTINFLAAVRTTRAALPHLLAHGTGTTVTVYSVNSFCPTRWSSTTASPRRPWRTSARRCPKRSAPRASASTRSARAPSVQRCGSAMTAWPRRSPEPVAANPRRSPRGPPTIR
jgi:NAD(P)-dependent dehydrogenase (short-subunit alcohol dehydrogenase family)